MSKKIKLKKRWWHYLLQPHDYQVCCMRGGKVNDKHKVAWSEFEGMIWCIDCKKDMKGFDGIFGGPIMWELTKMVLGKYCFHRYNMRKKVVEAPVFEKDKIVYRTDNELTKKLKTSKETKK